MIFQKFRRFGTGRCEIISLEILDSQGQETAFVMPGETLLLKGKIISHSHVNNPLFGITMYDRLRVAITAWNTTQYEYKLPPLEKGKVICVTFKIKWPHIKSDSYSLEPAIADGSQENHEMMDWIQAPVTLQSGVTDLTFGFIRFIDVTVSHESETFINNQLLSESLLK